MATGILLLVFCSGLLVFLAMWFLAGNVEREWKRELYKGIKLEYRRD